MCVDNYILERVQKEEEYNPHKEEVIQATKSMCRVILDAIVKID